MALGLDLSSSEAKLARAWDHLRTLEREVPASIKKRGAYAIRFSQVDPQTGWCDVIMTPTKRGKPLPSVVLGDVIHNLRCALDYIVTALVEASQTKLTTRHQFPIYRKKPDYINSVGTPTKAVKSGPLGGVKHGLALIEQLQPYKIKPDPRQDPLWHVHRFSNADKHRQPVALLAVPQGGDPIQLNFNGIPVDCETIDEIKNWSPNQEYVIHRIRFNPPRAYNLRADGPLRLQVSFTTPAFGGEPAHSASLPQLRESCRSVSMAIDAFKLL